MICQAIIKQTGGVADGEAEDLVGRDGGAIRACLRRCARVVERNLSNQTIVITESSPRKQSLTAIGCEQTERANCVGKIAQA